jgi:hypothetical protein
MVGLLHMPLTTISFQKVETWASGEKELGPAVRYNFYVTPEGIARHPQYHITYAQPVTICYFPLTHRFRIHWNGATYPIECLAEYLKTHAVLVHHITNQTYTLTEQAQAELVHAFQAVRRH